MPGRRILKPKAKDHRDIPIPDDLRAAFQSACEIVQAAGRDPDERIDYDDAIQVGGLCGGRIGKGRRPFIFKYFGVEGKHDRWYFSLHDFEVEDIADGVISSLKMYCCTSPECGCKFRDADQHCFYCDYEEDPDHGTFPLAEALPRLEKLGIHGISETLTLEAAKKLLGEPFATGDARGVSALTIDPWAKFRVGEKVVHIEFWKKSGLIKAVTISSADSR